jgi:hypothetical protein
MPKSQRVNFESLFDGCFRFGVKTAKHQRLSEQIVRVGGIRIEFDGFSRASFGFRQIPIKTHTKISVRGVNFGGSRIKFDGFHDGFFDLRESVLRTAKIENHLQNINISESGYACA